MSMPHNRRQSMWLLLSPHSGDRKQQKRRRVSVVTKLKLRVAANASMTLSEQNLERVMNYFQDRSVRRAGQ